MRSENETKSEEDTDVIRINDNINGSWNVNSTRPAGSSAEGVYEGRCRGYTSFGIWYVISQSFLDLDYIRQNKYTTMTVSTAEGNRCYLLADIDSVVMPKRIVFHGYTEVPVNHAERRTSFKGTFPGEGTGNVTFRWTDNDHIRLDVGVESRAEGLTDNNTNANFVFEDLDTEVTSYMVYYPDKNVTISTEQTQIGANNSEHIGHSGDCGTVVTKSLSRVSSAENGDSVDRSSPI